MTIQTPASPQRSSPRPGSAAPFLNALQHLLPQRSLSDIKPADIAQEAERPLAEFLEVFADEIDAVQLLAAHQIADRIETSASAFTFDRWKTASLHEVISSAVHYLVTQVVPDNGISRAISEASLGDHRLMEIRRASLVFDIGLLGALLSTRADELGPDANRSVDLCIEVIESTLDRAMLLGSERDPDVLAATLYEMAERMLLLRTVSAAAFSAEVTADITLEDRQGVVVVSEAAFPQLMNAASRSASLDFHAIHVEKAADALDQITAHDSPAVFLSWSDKETEAREVLHRVQSSAWLSSVITVVLTSGKADELSMAYALGARVAVTQPSDEAGVVDLLRQIDKLLQGSGHS